MNELELLSGQDGELVSYTGPTTEQAPTLEAAHNLG